VCLHSPASLCRAGAPPAMARPVWRPASGGAVVAG